MILEKYWELLRKINKLYQDEKYTEVIEFLDSSNVNFPYGKAALFYSGICAAAKLELFDKAIQFLKQINDKGDWYTEFILTQSPSLKPLQNLPEFKLEVQRSIKHSTQALKENYDITILPEDSAHPHPLMLALHADSGVIEEEIEFWKPITEKGYILGMPRSTNVYWSGKDSAYWPDHETASNQIRHYVKTLQENNSINIEKTIVGGLSSGAELAIWLALSQTIPVDKFIAVGPGGQWMNELEKWQPLIDKVAPRGITGIIILGKKDKVISHENIHALVKMLNESGIRCELHESPDVGHWYPPNFNKILSSLL
jgi:predicted esterase